MNKHKDLPPGSQAWANELDQALDTIKQLQEVVRRLTENAGIDFSNPQRGLNPVRDIPSNANPVGQKLSSLADVQIYNVADGQVLSWSNKGQRWLPVDLGTGIDISKISYSHQDRGYGNILATDNFAYYGAFASDRFGGEAEVWSSDATYVGSGSTARGSRAWIEVTFNNGNPFIKCAAFDSEANTEASFELYADGFRFFTPRVVLPTCTTATRPTGLANTTTDVGSLVFDRDLGIPIIWNGTGWTNLIGTAV